MKYVYLLQSLPHPNQHYVGLTSNVELRLASHNAGQSIYTAKYRPWKIVSYHAFLDEKKAVEFEKYLKSLFRSCVRPEALITMKSLSKPAHRSCLRQQAFSEGG